MTGHIPPMAHPPIQPAASAAEIAAQMAKFPPVTWADRLRVEVRDVGFLRHLWKNFGEVAPGVYRSNHPGPRRLRGYADMGIKAVLNLRGVIDRAPQRIEAETCAEVGMEFHSLSLSARQAPHREALLQLLDKFDTLPRPFLMHCKSGADRAGLASALYLLDQTDAPLAQARKELSIKYLHIAGSETGILDHVLDLYERDGPMLVRDWISDVYDRDVATATYTGPSRG